MIALILTLALASETRIVSFSPAITETLFDLDLGRFIVGTSDYSDYPAKAKDIPTVGAYTNPSLEKVISLRPNFIVSEKSHREDFFRKVGIEMVILESKKMSDFKKNILLLKQKFPSAKHEKVLNKWESNLKKLSRIKSKLSAIIQISQNPLMLAGKNTLLDNLLSMCGVENLFRKIGYKRISREFFSTFNVLKINISKEPNRMSGVKNVNPDFVSRLTLRSSENLYQICLDLMN